MSGVRNGVQMRQDFHCAFVGTKEMCREEGADCRGLAGAGTSLMKQQQFPVSVGDAGGVSCAGGNGGCDEGCVKSDSADTMDTGPDAAGTTAVGAGSLVSFCAGAREAGAKVVGTGFERAVRAVAGANSVRSPLKGAGAGSLDRAGLGADVLRPLPIFSTESLGGMREVPGLSPTLSPLVSLEVLRLGVWEIG